MWSVGVQVDDTSSLPGPGPFILTLPRGSLRRLLEPGLPDPTSANNDLIESILAARRPSWGHASISRTYIRPAFQDRAEPPINIRRLNFLTKVMPLRWTHLKLGNRYCHVKVREHNQYFISTHRTSSNPCRSQSSTSAKIGPRTMLASTYGLVLY